MIDMGNGITNVQDIFVIFVLCVEVWWPLVSTSDSLIYLFLLMFR